jgi:hypothetical protein
MRKCMFVVATLVLGTVAPASSQIAWDGPSLIGPASPSGFAIFLTEPSPGDGLGALATWRHQRGALDIGYRASAGEGASGDLAIAAGIDISGPLARGVEDSDIDVIWWSGVGAGLGDEIMVSVPVGIAVGWTGAGDDVVFSPYAGGHVSMDVATGEGDALDLNGGVDVGLDLTLVSGWVVRAGASFGSRNALAIGLRIPRGSDRVRN